MKEEKLAEAVVGKVQDPALKEARLEQICDAALDLFLEKGFASTTIRDICARSGVNQASIYDYIANKNDILRRLLNRLWFEHDVPSLAERLSRQGDRALTDIIAEYLKETWSHKRQGTLLVYRSVPYLQADDRRAMRARDEAVIAALAARLRERAGLPEQDRRAEVMANLIIFISAFAPMRDWLGRDIDDDLMLRTVAAGVAAMIEELARG
ncbi:MAG: TetR/AcrR family transcriptional regulator [Alcanivorax sp.]|uniref:TetR/AcrR family transcriptional regulator n=1 Tax=Alloalcanivorax marinus TaxID=1177169 RepID=A0A9Q3YQZ3_9GAMM|nr:TetR/AcrR family transcriptional regulator [Alloalcanivorax marinus]MBM7335195.1 TetR/AcrR family transcriptional regulator [Alloalcanivorax marinus]MCC4310305.1 TetR/AcrR family transcriptional regulator [Alloalcanivorax marinus]MCH2557460.1 TetR/AcrR family transcriptional regulator [Alcanivorax sp.]MCU5788012.1 TetR family transcriptional regulator [Alloalcanivorax marinus]